MFGRKILIAKDLGFETMTKDGNTVVLMNVKSNKKEVAIAMDMEMIGELLTGVAENLQIVPNNCNVRKDDVMYR